MSFIVNRKFRYQLNNQYLNLNALYEFESDAMVVTSFKVDDFVLPRFDLKLELTDWTVPDDFKK